MSDFDNDNDDLFNFDDDDDLFGDDDPFADDGSEFDFDTDEFAALDAEGLDAEDDALGDVFADDGNVVIDTGGTRRGFSAAFGVLSVLLIMAMLVGLFLIAWFGFINVPVDEQTVALQMTATSISLTNEAVGTAGALTATAQAERFMTETAIASITPSVTPSPTNTRMPTNTPRPSLDPTEIQLTANVLAQTSTAAAAARQTSAAQTEAARPTATPITPTVAPTSDVATPEPVDPIVATATALALLQVNQTQTADPNGVISSPAPPTPTISEQGGAIDPTIGTPVGGGNIGIVEQSQLPNAGLFDDFAAGSSFGLIVLSAFGLLGVIAVSRRTRSKLEETDEEEIVT